MLGNPGSKQLPAVVMQSTAGSYLKDGLPNITGKFKVAGGNGGLDFCSGAFYTTNDTYDNHPFKTGSYLSGYGVLDASRASTVYGSSAKVQPLALMVQYLIRY